MPDPVIALYWNINGQNYGPYDWATCKQMAANKQFTEQSMVWMDGMPAWAPAGQVEILKPLFAPAMPPAMPPIPGGATPPSMPGGNVKLRIELTENKDNKRKKTWLQAMIDYVQDMASA